jgi:hypothetical protein
MKRWAAIAIGLCFIGLTAAWHAQQASGQADAGWVTLFDGKNLDNWEQVGDANWKVVDGVVEADKGNGFLVSKNSYKDFQIRAEFWVDTPANSGIFIRCEDPKKPGAKTCYECNIFDTRPDPTYGTGSIVYHAEVNPMPKAGGKWSTMEITAKGRDLSIMFDGQKTSSVRSGVHTEGPFALQYGAGVVKFRKVQIKPL